jgi:hypothetical protein
MSFGASVVIAITEIVGIFAIWYQLKKQKDINIASFLMEFDQNFGEHKNIYSKISQYQNDKSVFTEQDIADIVAYLTFFESLYYFIQKGILTIEMVDNLFGYRFFIGVHNEFIQKFELIKDSQYYLNIYKLHAKWIDYRKKCGGFIPEKENSLENVDNYNKLIS